MYEISDCRNIIVLTLFYHSFNVNFVSLGRIEYRHILSTDFSLKDQLYYVF